MVRLLFFLVLQGVTEERREAGNETICGELGMSPSKGRTEYKFNKQINVIASICFRRQTYFLGLIVELKHCKWQVW